MVGTHPATLIYNEQINKKLENILFDIYEKYKSVNKNNNLNNQNNNQSLFNDQGRRIPFDGMRVFNKVSLSYYKIKQPKLSFDDILSNSQKHAGVSTKVTSKSFETVIGW